MLDQFLHIPIPVPKSGKDQGVFGRSDSTKQITIRLSPYERERIAEAAELLNFAHIGDFMRQLAVSSAEEIINGLQ